MEQFLQNQLLKYNASAVSLYGQHWGSLVSFIDDQNTQICGQNLSLLDVFKLQIESNNKAKANLKPTPLGIEFSKSVSMKQLIRNRVS